MRAKRDKPGEVEFQRAGSYLFPIVQIITMRWTMTASDRRVHEHLVRELQDPPGGVPSLAEARWEALRCYLKPVRTFLINQR